MATHYWYNEATAKSRVKNIKAKYEELAKACMSLGNTMKTYVNVKNKWCDENAQIVSQWWNQDSSGVSSGRLEWTDSGLIIARNQATKYDGEDRIKNIMNQAAQLYYNAVCVPLSSLQSSFPTIKKVFEPEITLCINMCGNAKGSYTNQTMAGLWWQRAMRDDIGCQSIYKTNKLNTTKISGKNNTAEINNFINLVVKQVKNIQNKLDDYVEYIQKTCNNTNDVKYWGFSDSLKKELKSDINDISEDARNKLKNFINNLNTALGHANKHTELDLKKLSANIVKGK